MKRKLVMGLLLLGTIGGYAAGFSSMRCRAQARREAFEARVADVCVRAAQNVSTEDEGAGEERPRRRGHHAERGEHGRRGGDAER